jgi:hypothetical protein
MKYAKVMKFTNFCGCSVPYEVYLLKRAVKMYYMLQLVVNTLLVQYVIQTLPSLVSEPMRNASVFRSIQETKILLKHWFKPLISSLVLVEKRTNRFTGFQDFVHCPEF